MNVMCSWKLPTKIFLLCCRYWYRKFWTTYVACNTNNSLYLYVEYSDKLDIGYNTFFQCFHNSRDGFREIVKPWLNISILEGGGGIPLFQKIVLYS